MATINMSQFLWAKQNELSYILKGATGPQSVRPNVNLFGLKSQEIKKANEKFTLRKTTTGTLNQIRIPFQFITSIPTWSKGATYSQDTVIGRFEPINIYSHSNPQQIKLELIYHAESLNNGDWSLQKIEEDYTPKLKSLPYPQYDGRFSPPTPMLLNIGTHWIDVPVIINQVDIEPMGPFDIDGLKSHTIKVIIDLTVAYPIYQAISQSVIIDTSDNTVFAKKEFSSPYLSADKTEQNILAKPITPLTTSQAVASPNVSGFTGVNNNIPIIEF